MRDKVKILTVVTADYASVEPQSNKLNLIGVFGNIGVTEFPATHRRMYLAVVIAGEPNDSPNPHRLAVTISDSEDLVLARFEGSFEMPQISNAITPVRNMLVELNDLEFRYPGQYSFAATLNDGEASGLASVHVYRNET